MAKYRPPTTDEAAFHARVARHQAEGTPETLVEEFAKYLQKKGMVDVPLNELSMRFNWYLKKLRSGDDS